MSAAASLVAFGVWWECRGTTAVMFSCGEGGNGYTWHLQHHVSCCTHGKIGLPTSLPMQIVRRGVSDYVDSFDAAKRVDQQRAHYGESFVEPVDLRHEKHEWSALMTELGA